MSDSENVNVLHSVCRLTHARYACEPVNGRILVGHVAARYASSIAERVDESVHVAHIDPTIPVRMATRHGQEMNVGALHCRRTGFFFPDSMQA